MTKWNKCRCGNPETGKRDGQCCCSYCEGYADALDCNEVYDHGDPPPEGATIEPCDMNWPNVRDRGQWFWSHCDYDGYTDTRRDAVRSVELVDDLNRECEKALEAAKLVGHDPNQGVSFSPGIIDSGEIELCLNVEGKCGSVFLSRYIWEDLGKRAGWPQGCSDDAEAARLREALSKINAIRNSVVGTQTVNWSAHIYPLVAALNEAGFDGQGYGDARAEAKTLIEQRDEAIRERDEARAKMEMLRRPVDEPGLRDACRAALDVAMSLTVAASNAKADAERRASAARDARSALDDAKDAYRAFTLAQLISERDEARADAARYRERLQIDPGGSDKIDELESALDFARHTIEQLSNRDKEK